jgi:hypothetical protein
LLLLRLYFFILYIAARCRGLYRSLYRGWYFLVSVRILDRWYLYRYRGFWRYIFFFIF